MSRVRYDIATPAGRLSCRSERDDDETFLATLFAANQAPMFRHTGLSPEVIDHLVTLQYRSQKTTYRAQYPGAQFSIIEADHRPVGRLVLRDEGNAISIVDIAVLPEVQRQRIGSVVVGVVLDEAANAHRGVRAMVLITNQPSRSMFRRLGFAETDAEDGAYLELRWTQGAPTSSE